MDAREAKAEWDELSGLYLAKNYTRAKFADEIQNRLEVVMLRVVQGLACAHKHDLFSPAQRAQAQEALVRDRTSIIPAFPRAPAESG